MSTNPATLLDKHRTLLELRADPDLKPRLVCYHTPRHLERRIIERAELFETSATAVFTDIILQGLVTPPPPVFTGQTPASSKVSIQRTWRIPAAAATAVTDLAKERGITQSQLVADIITRHLQGTRRVHA